jgi:hypothetical protein
MAQSAVASNNVPEPDGQVEPPPSPQGGAGTTANRVSGMETNSHQLDGPIAISNNDLPNTNAEDVASFSFSAMEGQIGSPKEASAK